MKTSSYCFIAETEDGIYRSVISAYDKAGALHKAFYEVAASYYQVEIKKLSRLK